MPPESTSVPLTRIVAGGVDASTHDDVAVEEPLELRVEGRSVAVTMRTPGHDDELVVGFLLTEGVIRDASDLLEVNQCPSTAGAEGNVVDVLLRNPGAVDFSRLTRHVFSTSSCGLCGKATIDAVHQRLAPLGPIEAPSRAPLLMLPERLATQQSTFQRTGGLHAAALFDADGHLLGVREDVGRHNAVDKVLGGLVLGRISSQPGNDAASEGRPASREERRGSSFGLLVSGRVSFEIVQKALAARIGIVAGISAPTSLAVEFARTSGQTLVGFLRPGRLNVYAGQVR